jgi:hypothetical protein
VKVGPCTGKIVARKASPLIPLTFREFIIKISHSTRPPSLRDAGGVALLSGSQFPSQTNQHARDPFD